MFSIEAVENYSSHTKEQCILKLYTQTKYFMHTKTYLLIGAVVVVVIGYSLFMWFQTSLRVRTSAPSQESAVQNITVTSQEKAYGISGKVVEVEKESFAIETSVLPGFDVTDTSWRWVVRYTPTTTILRDNTKEPIGSLVNLKSGNRVTIISTEDIAPQFPQNYKEIHASEIRLYP